MSGKNRSNLIDIPSSVLSNTWFGDKSAGERCYSLGVPFECTPDKLDSGATPVICTLDVRNGSEERLMFERICVHVENLSIFADEDRLWTNEINVLFKGIDQISQINIQNSSPKNVPAARMLAGPREISNKSILHRSFTKAKAASFGGGDGPRLSLKVFPESGGFSNTVSPLWGRNPQTAGFAGGC